MTNMKKLAIFSSDGPLAEGWLNVGISLEHTGLGVLEIWTPNQPATRIHLKPEVLRRIADAAFRAAVEIETKGT
jgi:hypothetical protein